MISMIRNKYLTLIGAGLLFTVVSCTDGYEPEPVELVSIDFVFSKTDSLGTNAVKFMNNIYATLQNGHNRVGSDYLDAASDDAISINVSDPDVYKLAMGRYTASTRVESDMRWKEYYSGIRKANILINHIDVVPFMLTYKNAKGETKPLNVTMKAEARFLRAYFYFELVKRYGGVPLMGDDVHILGDDMEIPRNTFEQCVQYICDELDDIKDDLRTNPMPDFEQYAHTPTREACLALKSRVLLYAASPLFNERPIEIGNELIGYASYDRERWNDAAKAAKTFIDEYGPNGNGAYGLTQSTSDGDNRDFRDVFLGFYNKTNNPEVIFYRPGGEDKSIESNNGPLGFSGDNLGKGRTLPTQNLVDAFPMKDGMFAGQGSKYTLNQSNPYENRDPRLDYTILHHGSSWLNNTLDISIGGVNNPSNSAEYSKTGYYMCKFMGKFGEESQYGNKIHLWVMFRYAEMLLNYAEAMNEYLSSPSQDVYDAIIALRARAGIEAGNDESPYGLKKNMTQAEMREVIQNERRIEMAFEEQRYWDIRRWRIAEEIFKNPLEGLEIRVKGNTTSFNEVDVLSTTFDVKRYLYPIPSNSAEYSKTGYYMCKFMGKFGEESQYGNKIHLWVMFRYAEMLLNYAEAMNEYLSSPSQDVYDAIIALRARAGIEAGNDESPYGLKKNMTQAEMREVIQNERRIEMAFEEQRYWDIRRWRIAEEIFKNPLEGLEIRVKGNTTSFNEVDVLSTTFDVKRYLYPIPYNEVVKNDNMIQNPKW